MLARQRRIAALLLGACLAAPGAHGQDAVPFLPDQERFGRPQDGFELPICVDQRDSAASIDQAIAEAVAGTLLLEPSIEVIAATAERDPFDDLYRHLLQDCRLYLGLRVLPDFYPAWLALTRPYYEVGYVYVARDTGLARLGDLPASEAIAVTLGTSADLQLLQYMDSRPGEPRWPRFPNADDRRALAQVVNGTAAVALVWAPAYWAMAQADPAIAALKVIASDPLPAVTVPVAAAMLSENETLRRQVDEAIASLLADGTIARILTEAGFPATPAALR